MKGSKQPLTSFSPFHVVYVILNMHTVCKDHLHLSLKNIYLFFFLCRMITLTDELIAAKLKHVQVSTVVHFTEICYIIRGQKKW
jgi:hypothetical protein